MCSVSASPGILCLKPIAEEPEPEEHDVHDDDVDHTDSQSTPFRLEPPSSALEADESGTCTLSSRSSSSSMTIAVPGNSIPCVLLSLAAHWAVILCFLAKQTLAPNLRNLLGRSLTMAGGGVPLRGFGILPVGCLQRLFEEGLLLIGRRVFHTYHLSPTISLLLHYSLLNFGNAKKAILLPQTPCAPSARVPIVWRPGMG